MPTVLDSLTIELGWDVKKFLEGAKETEARVKNTREDFERTSKVWDAAISGLVRQLSVLVAAFLSVEAAISAIEWTKGASQAGSEFSNLAETIGMSTTRLSEWDQALQRVGGRTGEMGAAFAFQQSELQKMKGPKGGAPSFLDWIQRLGLGDPNKYYDPNTKTFDVDKMNRDISDAMQRQNMSAAQRQQVLEAFGYKSPAAQRLFSQSIDEQLARQRDTAMTRANEETFRHLQENWTDLGNTAQAVYRDVVTYLETPLSTVLTILKEVLDSLRTWTPPSWMSPGGQSGAGGHFPTEMYKPFTDPIQEWWKRNTTPQVSPGGSVVPTTPGGGPTKELREFVQPKVESFQNWWRRNTTPQSVPTTPETPPAPAPSLGEPLPTPSVPGGAVTSGGAIMLGPHTGKRAPAGAGAVGPQSLLDLPRSARAFAASETGGSVTTTNSSSVTIGAMTFNSRSSDTAMGQAPSGSNKDLSVASYARHADTALE